MHLCLSAQLLLVHMKQLVVLCRYSDSNTESTIDIGDDLFD